jgi:hypothetical protein
MGTGRQSAQNHALKCISNDENGIVTRLFSGDAGDVLALAAELYSGRRSAEPYRQGEQALIAKWSRSLHGKNRIDVNELLTLLNRNATCRQTVLDIAAPWRETAFRWRYDSHRGPCPPASLLGIRHSLVQMIENPSPEAYHALLYWSYSW